MAGSNWCVANFTAKDAMAIMQSNQAVKISRLRYLVPRYFVSQE